MFRKFFILGLFFHTPIFLYANLVFEQTVLNKDLPIETINFKFLFKFKNTGKTPITIMDIQTSCGCTVAKSDKKTYLPNEKGEITGVFSVGNRKGIQNKTIVLLTNNLGQSQIQLDLNLKILQAIESSSRILFWKIGKPFKEKEVEVSIVPQYKFSRLIYDKNKFNIITNNDGNIIKLIVKPLDTKAPFRDTLKVVAKPTNGPELIHSIYLILK